MTYQEKLDDKIKALNSTRVYKKITPKYDLSWWIKWTASVFILFGVMCRSIEELPKIWDVHFSIVGVLGWFIVGMLWHDRALIMLNGVLFFMLAGSLLRFYVGGF
jgi:hypothetical protein